MDDVSNKGMKAADTPTPEAAAITSDHIDPSSTIPRPSATISTRLILGILMLLALIIAGGGWHYYTGKKAAVHRNAQEILISIAELKVEQIANWLKERRGDAEASHSKRLAREFLAEPDNPALREELLEWMTTIQRIADYSAVTLFDAHGSAVLSTSADPLPQQANTADHIMNALHSREIIFADLHRAQADMPIHMSFLMPISSKPQAGSADASQADGVLVFMIDPNRFFYPFVQSWPTPSRTAESLLIRHEGNEVVFLNELRHRGDTALALRLPMDANPGLPEVMAVQGHEGLVEGVDYRGRPVQAVVRTIPDTPWFMVVKQDQEEIDAPMREEAWTVSLIAALLLIAAGLGCILVRRQQQLIFLQREAAGRRQAEEAQARLAREWQTTFDNVRDAIWLFDVDQRILRTNRMAEEIFGRPAEAMRGKYCWEIVHGTQEPIPECPVMRMRRSLRREQMELTIGKRVFEVTVDPILDADGNLTGGVHIISDITERKRLTDALQSSQIYLQAVLDSVNDAVFVDDADTGQIIDVNHRCCAMYGSTYEEILSTPIGNLSQGQSPYSQTEAVEWLDKTRRQGPQVFEWLAKHKDGSLFWVEVNAHFVVIGGANRFVVAVRDINERKKMQETLLASEERRRLAMTVANDGLWDWDLTTNEVYFDPRYYLMAGYAVDAFPHQLEAFQQRVHPDDLAHVMAEAQKHLSGQSDRFEVEFRFRKQDNGYLWIHAKGQIVARGEQGEAVRLVGTHTDITKRKQTEEGLYLNYLLLQIAGETAGFGGWSVDLSNNICTWSDTVADLHEVPRGYAPPVEEGIYFYAPEWREKIIQVFSACAREGIPYDEDMEIITRKGKRVWVRTIGKAVRNEDGTITKVQGSFQDITERKQAEESLRESNEILALFIKNSPIYAFLKEVTSTESRVLWASENFKDMIGTTGSKMTGKRMEELFPQELAKKISQDDWHVVSKGEIIHIDEELNNREYQTIKFPIIAAKKNLLAGYTIDITERNQAEKEKEKLQAQLAQAQKMESVGLLAGGVAHDFNNMLMTILGNVELAKEQLGPDEPLQDHLDEIQNAAQRSADLTRQLLAFARKQIVTPRVLDLNETVEDMLKMLRRLIGEDIDLAWLPGSNLGPVYIDPSQLDQILANLCVNARDAIVGVGKITIETGSVSFDEAYCAQHAGAVPGEYILLAVSDDGCGMNAETQRHLFEPFFTTKEMGKGTGLGLATVYGAVKQNNSFINVYSEPGHGTTFKIYLPRYEDKATPLPKQQQSPAIGDETILLVEDEPAILKMTTRTLAGMGYSVIAAATPGEAIRLAQEHQGHIDLLITDVIMPEMNGRDLAANLLSIYPNIKPLFMSGYTADVIAHRSVLDQGMHFIEKPFTKNGLATKIREVLDRQ